jgi:hypothetical protein
MEKVQETLMMVGKTGFKNEVLNDGIDNLCCDFIFSNRETNNSKNNSKHLLEMSNFFHNRIIMNNFSKFLFTLL